MDWPASPFWDYSLELYARPGVEAACLELQERRGIDVNLVLLGCWLGSRGVALERDRAARVASAVERWQRDVVGPLRAVRRRLKDRPAQAGSETVTGRWPALAAVLRQRVLALELDGEHLEQLYLAELVADLAEEMPAGIALAGSNLRAWGRFGPVDQPALSTLLRAAFPEQSAAAEDVLAWLKG